MVIWVKFIHAMRQVLRAGALGRPRGMGWEGRWEGGSGWGTHVYPWLIHVNVWQKPLQYCKVISLQLIKINEKKNSPIPACFISLIPKMSVFTLAISRLTTSNLPLFTDLKFQAPMQYCSLQHWSLLPSPVTSTTGCCFYFGSISPFFLELFLHWSPVAYWAPIDPGEFIFQCHAFLPFQYCSWDS